MLKFQQILEKKDKNLLETGNLQATLNFQHVTHPVETIKL